MSIEELVKIANDRNELEFLYQITKSIAESDSIGEGWSYCPEYTRDEFNDGSKGNPHNRADGGGYSDYLEHGSAPLYELYLKHINYNK